MGSETSQDNERPVHRVWIDEFELAVCQVTNAEYEFFSPLCKIVRRSTGASLTFRIPNKQSWELRGSMLSLIAIG